MEMNYEIMFSDHIERLVFNGDQGHGHCPFHDDKTASFSCNKGTGNWTCHAGCGSGTAYKFAVRIGLDNPEKYKCHKQDSNVADINGKSGPTDYTDSEQSEIIELKKKIKRFKAKLVKIWESHPCSKYWNPTIVDELDIGFDGNNFVFTHHDKDGTPIAYQLHKGPIIGIRKEAKWYAQHFLKKDSREKTLFINEGPKDVVTLRSIGMQATSSTAGANSIPKDCTSISGFKVYIIVYDHDRAGRKGALKLAELLRTLNPGATIKIAQWRKDLPEKYDVTEDAKATNLDEFDLAVKNAITVSTHEKAFTTLVDINDTDAPESPDFPVFQQACCKIDLSLLTPGLKDLMTMIDGVSDAPDEFLITAILGIWAGVVGKEIIGPSGLYPNINAIIFAPSSKIRKSEAIKTVRRLFDKSQDYLDKIYHNESRKYKRELKKWEDGDRSGSMPQKPKRMILLLPSDFSEAGFINLMKDNPIAGVICTTEYSDYHQKLHRDSTGMATAMLSAYDGDTMQRLTIKRSLEIFSNPAFTVLGSTTLKEFGRVFGSTERENGSLQRVLPVVITHPTKKRVNFLRKKTLSNSASNIIYNKCLNWFPKQGLKNWQTPTFYFPEPLIQEFDAWEDDFIYNAETYGIDGLEGSAERMIAATIKLAMLIEAYETKDPSKLGKTKVSREALRCAQMLIEKIYFPSMVYLWQTQITQSPYMLKETKILGIISNSGGKISRSVLTKKSGIKIEELDQVLIRLVQKNQIIIEKDHQERHQGGGNPKTYYVLSSYAAPQAKSGKSGKSGV